MDRHGQTDRQTDRYRFRQTDGHILKDSDCLSDRDRQTVRLINTEIQTDRLRYRQADRQTDSLFWTLRSSACFLHHTDFIDIFRRQFTSTCAWRGTKRSHSEQKQLLWKSAANICFNMELVVTVTSSCCLKTRCSQWETVCMQRSGLLMMGQSCGGGATVDVDKKRVNLGGFWQLSHEEA